MIRPVMKEVIFLNRKSETAMKADKQMVRDMHDTLKVNEAGCVGMAANMIDSRREI